jgi:branched-chain amino acid transport system ATP-binding protein
MTDLALSIEDVTSGYGPVTVLRGVSMTVAQGEIVAVLGSNGAGKSTLMKTITGLLKATAGRIKTYGADISRVPAEKIASNGIMMVPEGRQLFTDMSVSDNLLLGAYTHKRDRAANAKQREVVNDLFPILAERPHQRAGDMSGGQQQMVAIGRGLMARPRVLLLDEPSLGLAPKVTEQVFESLGRLRALGTTVLIVEQNALQALELADRAYVLETGRVTMEGTAQELKNDPRVRAAYLGPGADAAV